MWKHKKDDKKKIWEKRSERMSNSNDDHHNNNKIAYTHTLNIIQYDSWPLNPARVTTNWILHRNMMAVFFSALLFGRTGDSILYTLYLFSVRMAAKTMQHTHTLTLTYTNISATFISYLTGVVVRRLSLPFCCCCYRSLLLILLLVVELMVFCYYALYMVICAKAMLVVYVK